MPLFVVATPIGNLADLSPRARETLATADLLLCEDTRVTRKLLAALGLPSPELWRCDAWREDEQAAAVVARLHAGARVVLVSDAGTPAISDPGGRVVAACHAAGFPAATVPGPSSITAALSAAGLPAATVHVVGFPPRKPGPRRRWLEERLRWPGTLVLLEAGRRVGELVQALAELAPEREAAICRELSKAHEEVLRGRVDALPCAPQRGEVVLVVGPGEPPPTAPAAELGEGSLREVAAVLAARWGVSRRDAYQRLLQVEAELAEG